MPKKSRRKSTTLKARLRAALPVPDKPIIDDHFLSVLSKFEDTACVLQEFLRTTGSLSKVGLTSERVQTRFPNTDIPHSAITLSVMVRGKSWYLLSAWVPLQAGAFTVRTHLRGDQICPDVAALDDLLVQFISDYRNLATADFL